ncbi:MAG: hypothetical protein AAF604_21575 [Acidobacteriota bacterium]
MKRTTMLCAVLVALITCPAFAADNIDRGIDVFTTLPNGTTYYDFAHNPVPADFFCPGSEPLEARVDLRGEPIATEVEGSLRFADTVIERLDDAVFDGSGLAETRVRFRALSLKSIAPIATECGLYELIIGLDGKQQMTTMRIYRQQAEGGHFNVPLAADVALTFRPLAGGKALTLPGHVRFTAQAIPWRHHGRADGRTVGLASFDTDGDTIPDTKLSGSTNFAPGWSTEAARSFCAAGCFECEPRICHESGTEQHCSGPICACGGDFNCP